MKQMNVKDIGLLPDTGACLSDRINGFFREVEDGTTVFFPAGRYFISKEILVRGKNGLTIEGEPGTVFVTHFTPWNNPAAENNNGFHCVDCKNLTFRNLTWTTDNPIGCAGRVTLVDQENHFYEVDIDPQFPITGWEHFWGTDTCDEEGTPDYVIETYEKITEETLIDENGCKRVKYTGTRYENLGNNHIRVFTDERHDLSRLTIGHRVLYRYVIYSSTVYLFSGCHDILLSHIEIERTTSMGIIVHPRCSNLTLEDFNIRIPKGDNALYSANADGIHITGLSGYLKMKDCDFLGLGDDALNIHSMAGTVAEWAPESGRLRTIHGRTGGKLNPLWAQAGDTIIVYDPATFHEKGKLLLSAYDDGIGTAKLIEGDCAVGDVMANNAFYASVHLDNCTVTHTRARGFLLQSHNMLVENCRIYGMSLPGIIVSPDIKFWHEVGPSRNVEIRNCVFEKCGIIGAPYMGAVMVKASHDIGIDTYPAGVHQGLYIHHNLFKNCGNIGIYASTVSGVNIHDNRFENCSSRWVGTPDETNMYDIMLRGCEDITTGNNTTTKDGAWLEKRENC